MKKAALLFVHAVHEISQVTFYRFLGSRPPIYLRECNVIHKHSISHAQINMLPLSQATKVALYRSALTIMESFSKSWCGNLKYLLLLLLEDFICHNTGVYEHKVSTKLPHLGGHAVRILGWGQEDGTPYW